MMGGAAPPASRCWRRCVANGTRWALLWLPLGIGLGIARPRVSDNPCWLRKEGPVHLAPDGAMAIQVEYEVCEYGFFITELRSRLEVWRVSAPEKRYTVATWEWPGGNRDSATVAWIGPGALHVSFSAWTGVALPRPPLAGLVLTVGQQAPEADDAQRRLR
jgi:hypothetical protein